MTDVQGLTDVDGASWVSLACGCNYLGAKIGRFDRQIQPHNNSEWE